MDIGNYFLVKFNEFVNSYYFKNLNYGGNLCQKGVFSYKRI